MFLCVLNHLIHTQLQETGAIINSCFTNEEAEVPSLKNTQEVIPAVSESKLGPRHYGPSNFTINHYSTLPLKNSGKKSFFFFFYSMASFLKRNNQQGPILSFIYFMNIITYDSTYIPAV